MWRDGGFATVASQQMLSTGLEYELDALANKDFQYLTKTYLPRKLKEKDWPGRSRAKITARYALSRRRLYVCSGRWIPLKDSSPTDSASTSDSTAL